MNTRSYCYFCGAELKEEFIEGKFRQVCSLCNKIHYENPLPVASVILSNQKREVLLVKRAHEPYKDMWCFPIGFAEVGESIEDAALRELREEAGVEGKIIQLIDVSSHINPVYGELLIVTFEAEKIGGIEKPGDDAIDCKYFPIDNMPKLAFDSQEKAVKTYKELKKDLWKIQDSLKKFFEGAKQDTISYKDSLLSDELINAVQNNSEKIITQWLNDITTNASTKSYHNFDKEELFTRANFIIGQLNKWLKGIKGEVEFKSFYFELGYKRKKDNVPIEELISSVSILKKHIWMFIYSYGVWEKAIDIYRMFELGERLVYFFDKAAYYMILGYKQEE
ncbi:MAG: NUDIX domain-containing protein [Syntrophorhabdaceae bacterium]|nr:NUDIX domain-containing protein [Syntrophorhabdaceae bacterium]